MYRTAYEQYCVEMIEMLLNSDNFEEYVSQSAIKASIKDLTRHYPEVTVDGTTAYKASRNKKIRMIKKYHRISTRAAKIIDALEIDSNTKINKLIHFEHIIPNEVIYKEVLMLKEKNSYVSKKMISSLNFTLP